MHGDCPLYQTIQTLSFVQHGFIPVQNPSLSENPVKSVLLGTYTLYVCILGGGCFILCVCVCTCLWRTRPTLGVISQVLFLSSEFRSVTDLELTELSSRLESVR